MLIILTFLLNVYPAIAGVHEVQFQDIASKLYLDGKMDVTPEQHKELECLTKVIWFEARGESGKGKRLVAEVVQNRRDFGKPFANTICGVVYQKGQFSWTVSREKSAIEFKDIIKKYRKNEEKQLLDTIKIALDVVVFNRPTTTNATHFCSSSCSFKNVEVLEKEGNHTFFRYLGN